MDAARFLAAWNILWDRYRGANPQHADHCTVNLREKQQALRLFRGRCRKPAVNLHSIRCMDVPLILRAVLQLRYFRVGLHAFSQCRDSPMGNPASPALCLMTVAAVEQLWCDTLPGMLFNLQHFWHRCRKVDNRLCIIRYRLTLQLAFRNFLHAGFYVQPVNLVDEPGQDFLGFVINVNRRTIQFPVSSSSVGFTTQCYPELLHCESQHREALRLPTC